MEYKFSTVFIRNAANLAQLFIGVQKKDKILNFYSFINQLITVVVQNLLFV